MTITTIPDEIRRYAWPATLATATILGSLAAACMMPFVALAVIVAATMSRLRGLVTVGSIWATNQILGFTIMGYPQTGYAFAWGVALGVASILALFVARGILFDRTAITALRMVGAFVLAFASCEGFLFGFALIAGGTETFSASIIGQILTNDATWFAGLAVMYLLVTRAAPNVFGPSPSVRLA